MTLTTAAKLKQPKRVPSHFIDFDFIVLFSVFLPSWMALKTLILAASGFVNLIFSFFIANERKKRITICSANRSLHFWDEGN